MKMNHQVLAVIAILFLSSFNSAIIEPTHPDVYSFKPITTLNDLSSEQIIENHSYFGINPYKEGAYEALGYH